MKKSVGKLCFLMTLALLTLVFANMVLTEAKISITGDVISRDGGVEVSSVLLKVSLHKGDSVSKPISISSDVGGEFKLSAENVQGIVLSEYNFILDREEKKQISIRFDTSTLDPGIYVGHIRIASLKDVSIIPVIFEVESEDVFFDTNLDIPPAFTELEPGGKLIAQLKIFDLTSGGTTEGLGVTTVDMEYFLYNLDGRVLSSETESIVVERQTRVTKTISLPTDLETGDYVFVAIAKYRSSVGVSSHLLSVKEQERLLFGSMFEGSNFNFFLIIIVFLVLFLGIIFLFVYLIHDRNKLFLELRKYNTQELRRQREFLLAQEKLIRRKRLSTPKKVKREVRKKIKELKSKQRKRIGEFRGLKKQGNIKEMERKLKDWKSLGYSTFVLESKLKGLNVKEMKALMNEWKRKGYR